MSKRKALLADISRCHGDTGAPICQTCARRIQMAHDDPQVTRPSWDEHWLKAAELFAEMSTCASGRKVGAVAVQDRRIVASGFNGVPARIKHPELCLRREYNIPSGEQPHLCGCQHAEANCIANAARHGASLLGATIYVTCQPCQTCMGMLANVGIARVVFRGAYPDSRSLDLAAEAGIRVDQLP